VAQAGEGAGARDPKDYWRDTFHENKGKTRTKIVTAPVNATKTKAKRKRRKEHLRKKFPASEMKPTGQAIA